MEPKLAIFKAFVAWVASLELQPESCGGNESANHWKQMVKVAIK